MASGGSEENLLLLSDKAFLADTVLLNIAQREFLEFMDQTMIKVRAELALAERQIHDEDLNRVRSGEPLSIEKVSKQIWSTGENAPEWAWLGRRARSTR